MFNRYPIYFQSPLHPIEINRSHPLARGLVAAYPLNEGRGLTVRDYSGYSNNGIIIPGTGSWNGTSRQQSFRFDGSASYIDCGTNNTLLKHDTAQSISAWVFPITEGEGGSGRVFSKSDATNGTHFLVTSASGNSSVQWQVDGSTDLLLRTVTGFLNLRAWNNIVVTWTGGLSTSSVHIYINKYEPGYVLAANGVALIDNSGFPISIGDRGAHDRSFDGYIQNLNAWTGRVLNQGEINQLFNDPWCLYTAVSSRKYFFFGGTVAKSPNPTYLRSFSKTLYKQVQKEDKIDRSNSINRGLIVSCPINDGGTSSSLGSIIKDKSGFNNNGTLVPGSGFWSGGQRSVAYSFDSNDFIRFNPLPFGTGANFSWSIWAYPYTPAASEYVFLCNGFDDGSNGNGVSLEIEAGNWKILHNHVGRTDSGIAAVPRAWAHLGIVAQEGTQSLYLNGKVVASTSTGFLTPTGCFTIGAQANLDSPTSTAWRWFNGMLQGFNGWNRALTPAEMNYIYVNQYSMYLPERARRMVTVIGIQSLAISVSDAITVSESTTVSNPTLPVNLSESVTLTESLTVTVSAAVVTFISLAPRFPTTMFFRRFREKPDDGTLIDQHSPFARGLVLSLPFTEGAGTYLLDRSGRRLVSATAGVPTWTAADKGLCMQFDGSTQNVSFPAYSLGITPLTIAAWFKVISLTERSFQAPPGSSNNGAVLFCTRVADTDKSPTFLVSSQPGTAKLIFTVDSSGLAQGAQSNTVISLNQWYFGVGVYTADLTVANFGGIWDVYLNGVKDGASNNFSLAGAFAGSFSGTSWFTAHNPQWANMSNIQLKSLQVWTRALQAHEIKTLYTSSFDMYSQQNQRRFFDFIYVAVSTVSINVSDTLTVAESVTIAESVTSISVSDSITVTESVTISETDPSISVNEAITVVDYLDKIVLPVLLIISPRYPIFHRGYNIYNKGSLVNRNNPISRGIVLAMPLNDGAGEYATDVSGFYNKASFAGPVNWVGNPKSGPLGMGGRVLDFAGGTYGSIPGDKVMFLTSGAISFWARTPSAVSGIIFATLTPGGSNNRQFPISFFASGAGVKIDVTQVDGGSNVIGVAQTIEVHSVDIWHHILYSSYSGDPAYSLYVDGKRQTMSFSAGSMSSFFFANCLTSADFLQLGAKSDISGQHQAYLTGNVRNLIIWNRPFQEWEARSLYEYPNQVFEAPSIKRFFIPPTVPDVQTLSVFETIAVTESATVSNALLFRSLSNSITVTESVTVSNSTLPISVIETITVSESITVTNTQISTSVFETITLTEFKQVSFVSFISKVETITLTESSTVSNPILPVNVFEAVSIFEAFTTTEVIFISNIETITLTESVTVRNTTLGPVSVSDSITLTESVTARLQNFISVIEMISLTELIQIQNHISNLIVSDALTLTEAVTMLDILGISVSEALSLIEFVRASEVSFISVFDSLVLSELVSVIEMLFVSIQDTSSATDELSTEKIQASHENLILKNKAVELDLAPLNGDFRLKSRRRDNG